MKKKLKFLYNNTKIGHFLIQNGINLYSFYLRHMVSEKKLIQRKFKKAFGFNINLNNPKTLNEKINWLKLNDRSALHTQCADKYAVRKYISKKIGDAYLIPLLLQTANPEEISPKLITDSQFVIKTNHDSGGIYIVKNSKTINWDDIRKALKGKLKKNYYYKNKEWQYKNIVPCIIVEALLTNKEGDIPYDYKLHCFNGKVRMISVDMGRGTNYHYRNWYNTSWEREPYKWSSPKGNGVFTDPSPIDVPKPFNLEKMITLSEKIAEDFDYVRVDWYDLDSKLYFGEITFHHDGGTKPILPIEWDYRLGSELILTNLDTHNVTKN